MRVFRRTTNAWPQALTSSFRWAPPAVPSLLHGVAMFHLPYQHPVVRRDASPLYFRSVYVDDLEPSTTLVQVVQAIAKAGPFGKVVSARLERQDGHPRISCLVEFDTEKAADSLRVAAINKHFQVRGMVPKIIKNYQLAFPTEAISPSFSRVLRIAGRPFEYGFNEEYLTHVLETDFNVTEYIKSLPPHMNWGLSSEPVTTYTAPNGQKVMVWPFFSNEHQTVPFKYALQRHFKTRLRIHFGDDPCADFSKIKAAPADSYWSSFRPRPTGPGPFFVNTNRT